MKFFNNTNQKGFTLIELLVSSAIFLATITVGISSLLLMHRASKITQYKKEQFDTLNAIMEDMVRNIRVGSFVRCDPTNNDYSDTSSGGIFSTNETPLSCPNDNYGWDGGTQYTDMQASLALTFEGFDGLHSDPYDQIGYVIATDPSTNKWSIFKTIGTDITSLVPGLSTNLTPNPIVIDPYQSGFTVVHAEDTDPIPTLVSIRLAGTVTYQGDSTPFIIQTAVMQRTPKD